MKYEKITKERVLDVFISIEFSWDGIGCINIKNTASLLKTSVYQVKKYVKELKKENFVELIMIDINNYHDNESDLYPPYWGYRITEGFKKTEKFIKEKTENDKSIENLSKHWYDIYNNFG